LSISPKEFNKGKRGMVITIGGAILTAIRKKADNLKNRVRKREKAKAAVIEQKRVTKPVPIVIIRLFFKCAKYSGHFWIRIR